MAMIFPLSRNDDGSYSLKILGYTFMDGIEFVPVAPHQYIFKDNGREMFVYIKNGIFELGTMDNIRSSTGIMPTVLRLDVGSAYEKENVLFDIISLIIPPAFELFD